MDDDAQPLRIGSYEFGAKNLFVIGLIIVGLFLAYVIFLKPKASASTTTATSPTTGGVGDASGTGGTVVTNDPSAVGSIETQLESLQQSNLATQQAVGGLSGLGTQLGGISTQLSGIAGTQASQGQTLATINANANSAARDAAGARTDASIAANAGNKLLANQASGKGYSSTHGPAWADVAHITNAGLGI